MEGAGSEISGACGTLISGNCRCGGSVWHGIPPAAGRCGTISFCRGISQAGGCSFSGKRSAVSGASVPEPGFFRNGISVHGGGAVSPGGVVSYRAGRRQMAVLSLRMERERNSTRVERRISGTVGKHI